MEAVDAFPSVLCGPDGKCCIAGSQADRDTVDTALAAIQHYLDQHKAELPGLPEIDFGATDSCEGYSESTLQAYGQQCATHARKLALMDAIKQVTILYEKDDYPVLTDICNLIATAK